MPSSKPYAFTRTAALTSASIVSLLAFAPEARAASTTASRPWGTVVWEDRAGACSDASRVASLAEQSLAAPTDRDPLFVRAEIDAARVGRRRASIFLRRGTAMSIREVDAASCEELARAAAVVVAMAHELGLDPPAKASEDVAPSPPPPAETGEASPTSPTAPPAALPEQPKASKPEASAIRIVNDRALSVAPLVDLGTLPGASAGVRARFARDFLLFGFALQGVLLPTTERNVQGVTLSTGYAAGGLRIFEGFRRGPWELDVGVGISLGTYWAEGIGTTIKREGATPPYAALEASLEGAYRLSNKVRLRLGLDQILHLNRPSYVSDDPSRVGSVWNPTATAFRASLGPELTF